MIYNTRLNQLGFISVLLVFVGVIVAQAGGVSSTASGFLWVGLICFTVQFLWNLLGFGPDSLTGEDPAPARLESGAAAPAAAGAAASSASAGDAARIQRLEQQNAQLLKENASLLKRVNPAGAAAAAAPAAAAAAAPAHDESAKLRADLKIAQSRLAALKSELSGLDARNAEREEEYRKNVRTLQAEIGELRGDAERRERVVTDAQAEMAELKPYVGILIEDFSKKERRETGVQGVRIQTVKPNTPAAAVGFLENDVIERMNSADMESSSNVMDNLVKRKPGDVCSFIVNRGGEALNIVMTVGHKELSKEAIAKLRRQASGMVLAEDL